MDDAPGPPPQKPVMPFGFTASMLEDQTSESAQIFIQTCTQCHMLPNPKLHTKKEWPDVVSRMINRLRRRKFFSSQPLFVPGNHKANQIVDYLSLHALDNGSETEASTSRQD